VRTIWRRWEGTRRCWSFADMATRTLPSCGRSCNVVSTQSRYSSNAHGSTIPDRADIIDKFILNKVYRDTAKMTTSGSQRGKRVKMLVFGAPMVSYECVGYVAGRCVALVWVVRWISRSFHFDELTAGNGRSGRTEHHGRNHVVE
jgi:hypothetical protein